MPFCLSNSREVSLVLSPTRKRLDLLKSNQRKSLEPAEARWTSSGATVTIIRSFGPLLKTRSAPTTHDLPLKLPHLSQVFLQQLPNLHVMQAGWVWDGGENVNVCIHGQSLKGVQARVKA